MRYVIPQDLFEYLVAMSLKLSLHTGEALPSVCERLSGLYTNTLIDDGVGLQIRETAEKALIAAKSMKHFTDEKIIGWYFYNLAWFCVNYDEYANRKSWLRRKFFDGFLYSKPSKKEDRERLFMQKFILYFYRLHLGTLPAAPAGWTG